MHSHEQAKKWYFLRFSIFGRWQENEILWGVGGIPARNFIKMKFSRVLVQVLQEWAILRPGARALIEGRVQGTKRDTCEIKVCNKNMAKNETKHYAKFESKWKTKRKALPSWVACQDYVAWPRRVASRQVPVHFVGAPGAVVRVSHLLACFGPAILARLPGRETVS